MNNTATRLKDNYNKFKKDQDSKIYDSIINPIIASIDKNLDSYIGCNYEASLILKSSELFENWKNVNVDEYSKILETIRNNAPSTYSFKYEDLQQKYQNQLSKIFADSIIQSYKNGHNHLEFNILLGISNGCSNVDIVNNIVFFFNESGDFEISKYLEELIVAMFTSNYYHTIVSSDGTDIKIIIKWL
jgi:hypothetical protein